MIHEEPFPLPHYCGIHTTAQRVSLPV